MKGEEKEEQDIVGLVQWFRMNDHDEVKRILDEFRKLHISHIRTKISWVEWCKEGGKEWYRWLLETLSRQLEVLPCLQYTPSGLGLTARQSSPLKHTEDFADFTEEVITGCGQFFDHIEFWNEPNQLSAYDYTSDPGWGLYCGMVKEAAIRSREKGKKTVLGGMSPVDPVWLQLMFDNGLMQFIDVVGIHGFPALFDYNWEGWDKEIGKIRKVLKRNSSAARLWITEAGYSTWKKDERRQLQEFIEANDAEADRVYWNGLKDQAVSYNSEDRFSRDERAQYMGMKNADNSPKLLYTLLCSHEPAELKSFRWMTQPVWGKEDEGYTLITGGAGFVGVNLADRLLSEGKKVMVFDNLSRSGVQKNLFWLKDKHQENLQIMIADIRDKEAVTRAVQHASQVFHFAAQVAVTSSLIQPYHDFEVNALGTLNVLEAIRNTPQQPPLVFTSTNKVYGDLEDVGLVMNGSRYYPENPSFREHGISERRSLDFHSPYGCTKGVADQYILDYARTFGLKTVVFRMSCIYGPHQFGTEDQGWVAHFLIQALKQKPITLYGDGKQVRDILFVEDLVNAFLLAQEHMDSIKGSAFNIGGGPGNTISLLELIDTIEHVSEERPEVIFDTWRPSDQKYYVSDFGKFQSVTGWQPMNGVMKGITRLYEWLQENADVPTRKRTTKRSSITSKTNLQTIDK